MAVPMFSDLGKSARDVFRSGFNFGVANFNINAKVANDFGFGGNIKYNFDQNKVSQSFILVIKKNQVHFNIKFVPVN